MDISAISGASGSSAAGQAQHHHAASKAAGGFRPGAELAGPTPGERIDGVVSNAAPAKEVAMNMDLLNRSMDAQRYVIDLLA